MPCLSRARMVGRPYSIAMRNLLISFVLLAMAASPYSVSASDSTPARPNIIFIMTDDMAPWAWGAAGNPEARTPNLDQLARDGAYLKNAFTTTPVCSPSRAALMASRYGTELGITDWINNKVEPKLGLDPAVVTWPEVLARAGYTNAMIGKWHLGELEQFHPLKTGYQHFMGFVGGGTKPKNPTLEVAGKTSEVPGFVSQLVTDDAIQFVRDHRAGPFMISLHFREPHAPYAPVAEEDAAPFAKLDPTIPNPDYPDLDAQRCKTFMREYLASVTSVDRHVGRLLATLDELGLRDNTVVVFTSDHGYNIGHNGIWHKGNGHWLLNSTRKLPPTDPRRQRPNMYENSLRVPAIVRWPAVIKPGTEIRQTITNLDWYPTLLAMAKVEPPQGETIRGRNFLPLLRGESISWDDDLYAQYSQHHYVRTALRSYSSDGWKLVRDFHNSGKDELYHLADDPGESTNRIAATDSPTVAAWEQLDRKLLAKMRSIHDPALEAPTGR
jgi:choline-sulfatase